MCIYGKFLIRRNAHFRVLLFLLLDVAVIATINNSSNSNTNLHDLAVQMMTVLIITIILVLLLLLEVLLLSLLLYAIIQREKRVVM